MNIERGHAIAVSPLRLTKSATIVIIGGGPAGAFSALNILRKSKAMGLDLKVYIIERRKCHATWGHHPSHLRGCNYCAGGISPRLNVVLKELGFELPAELIKNTIKSITVQSFWKNIEFKAPADRQMLAVYRGSLPSHRRDGLHNFDAFILGQCIKEGCIFVEAEVTHFEYSDSGNLRINIRESQENKTIDAEFMVYAGGVNYKPGHALLQIPLVKNLIQIIPDFSPPAVRHALVFEIELQPEYEHHLDGEIFFSEYGSKSLPLEMCSIVPKGQFATVVLIGKAIDHLQDHSQFMAVIQEFLRLPHIQKLFPGKVNLANICICNPNMVIGTSKNPYADRIAIVGDMATARLYKDGIMTAYQTSRALADAILHLGVDAESLRRGYWPTVKKVQDDNRYGRIIYWLHNVVFGSSILSRVIYQAIISERKTHLKADRQLEKILWHIASGDDLYKNIFTSIIHPLTIYSVLSGGGIKTLRNYLTERIFGLRWEGLGRFTTGVSLERLERKRLDYMRILEIQGMKWPSCLEFERMYSIKIKASPELVEAEIGKFGESDRKYFSPRFIQVMRIRGYPNHPECVIQYQVVLSNLTFSLILVGVINHRYFLYRVLDGFARDGILIFEVEQQPKDITLLSIYVAFDFYQGTHFISQAFWLLLKWLFPAFIHDVLWNHSLCQLKDNVESVSEQLKAKNIPAKIANDHVVDAGI